jgi:hypothetical protein
MLFHQFRVMKKSSSLFLITILISVLLIISVGLNIYLINEYSKLRAEQTIEEQNVLTQQPNN